MEKQNKTSNYNSVCQKLIAEVNKSTSINQLKLISDNADSIFCSDGNQDDRLAMTDDFWMEFTKVVGQKFNQLNEK